jgi:hypothetical protein
VIRSDALTPLPLHTGGLRLVYIPLTNIFDKKTPLGILYSSTQENRMATSTTTDTVTYNHDKALYERPIQQRRTAEIIECQNGLIFMPRLNDVHNPGSHMWAEAYVATDVEHLATLLAVHFELKKD